MTWTRADAASSSAAGTTSATATFTGAVAAGDLLVACCHCNTGDPPSLAVSDNINGAWPANDGVWSGLSGGSTGRLYIAHSNTAAASAGSMVVTCQGNAGSTRTRLLIARYVSNVGSQYSIVSIAEGASNPGIDGDSGFTAVAAGTDDLLVGAQENSLGSGVSFTAGTDGNGHSYAAGLEVDSWLFEEYILSAVAGTVKATVHNGQSLSSITCCVIFNAVGGGPAASAALTFWDNH